jgi:hypothetical protein
MPVSRQRKKGPSKPKSVQQGAKLRRKQDEQQAHQRELAELSGAFREIGEDRRRFDVRRREIAREHAGRLVQELVGIASGDDAAQFEDVVCARLGALMFALREADEVEDYVNPGQVFEAMLEGSAATVRRALAAIADDPDGWHRPWALFAALARTAFGEWAARARRLESDLRSRSGGGVLPEMIGCAPAGAVLWTRDAYGGRFAATAPFPAPEPGSSQRWYLWDIDGCGVDSFTVYSGYFADPAAALEAWRAGVGTVAGAQAAWTQADDPALLAFLLPKDLGMFEPGGESADQFVEYHRSRRLADETRASLGESEIPDIAARPNDPKAAEAARHFTAWLAEHRPDAPATEDQDEVVATLADDWFFGRHPGVLADACSPHRVALFAEHCGGYYQEDFAGRLTALLPDWVTWFAASTGVPETLAARCLRYAEGAPHPATSESHGIEMLARVEE